MGASQEIIVYTHKMRTFLAITLAIACFMASANQDVDEDFGPIMELVDMSPEGDLMTTLGDMQKVAPTHMHFHINRIAKHAVLLQMDKKAAAYTHNFDASKAAIKAALKALTNQLNDGHRHDKAALATGINEGTSAISSKKTSGKNKCQTFKDKACPTKREGMEADAAKADAKKKMQNVGKGKVCDSLGSTWGDMDVDKATPKYGDELRNKWDKKRGEYETARPSTTPLSRSTTTPSRSTTLPWLSSRPPSSSRLAMPSMRATRPTKSTTHSRRRWPATWLPASRCSSPLSW